MHIPCVPDWVTDSNLQLRAVIVLSPIPLAPPNLLPGGFWEFVSELSLWAGSNGWEAALAQVSTLRPQLSLPRPVSDDERCFLRNRCAFVSAARCGSVLKFSSAIFCPAALSSRLVCLCKQEGASDVRITDARGFDSSEGARGPILL